MAHYRDKMPGQMGWIHELARAEIHPDADQLLNWGRANDPQQMIEESTLEFISQIRDQLTEFAQAFNGYSEGGVKFPEVKIYSLAQTPADFMLFRNQVKLLFSNTAHGVIEVSFARHTQGTYTVDGQRIIEGKKTSAAPPPGIQLDEPQEILAEMGPFREVFWTFKGQRIEAQQLGKFYFQEFIKATRQPIKDKRTNDLLLKEIRQLLSERGLDL